MLLQGEVFLLLQLTPSNPLLTCLHRRLKNLRLLKLRLDFFLLSNQAGSSLDPSMFMWVTVTCSFAFLEHIEMGTSFLLKVPHGWAVQAYSALFSFNQFSASLWYVLNSVKAWRIPLLLTPAHFSALIKRATLRKNKGILWGSCTFGRQGQLGGNTKLLCALVCILRVTTSVSAAKSTEREEQPRYRLTSLPRHEKAANPSPQSFLKYPSYTQLLQHWWLGNFNGELWAEEEGENGSQQTHQQPDRKAFK